MNLKRSSLILASTLIVLFIASSVFGLAESIAAGNINITDASPGNNTFLSGSQTVSITVNPLGNAAIGANITNVTFYLLDRTLTYLNVFATDTTFNQSSYSVTLDTTSITDDFNMSILTVIHNGTAEVNFSGQSGGQHGALVINNITIDNTAPTITINYPPNTNTTSSGNFSVNYTFVDANPTSCSIKAGTQTITNTTNSSTGDNATFELGGGNHGISATCTDDAGNSASKTGNRIIIDDVSPFTDVIKFRDVITDDEQTTFEFGEKMKIDCNPKDNITAVQPSLIQIGVRGPSDGSPNNVTQSTISSDFNTLGEVVFTETKGVGDYLVVCHLFDYSGNSNKTNKTFNVKTKVHKSSAAGIPGFYSPKGKTRVNDGSTKDYGVLPSKGQSVLIGRGGRIIFTVDGEDHTAEVTDLSAERAGLKISSEPIEVTIAKGESVEVDVNQDGTNDVEVTFHSVFPPPKGRHGDFTFTPVSTPAQPTREQAEREAQERAKAAGVTASQAPLVVTIVVIIVIVLIGFVLIRGKKK